MENSKPSNVLRDIALALLLFGVAMLLPSANRPVQPNDAAFVMPSFPNALAAGAFQYPVSPYTPGSYENRTFFCCAGSVNGRHLGEDVALAEGTPIRAIGPGIIKVYGAATGYGELVVVIEHDLGQPHDFVNGYGNTVSTRYILSIYGHLRQSQARGGPATGLFENQSVAAGTIIGYVNDDAHNGDGAEHLHMGIRLSNAATAEANDASWFRGYERTTDFGKDYAAAGVVIASLMNQCGDGTSPVLLTESDLTRAIALDSVTMLRDPLPVATLNNFSADQHTRVMLFAVNASLVAGESISSITAQAEDSQHRIYPLSVEAVEKVPNFDCLTQVNVRLGDELASAGDVLISITVRGSTSNKVLLRIK